MMSDQVLLHPYHAVTASPNHSEAAILLNEMMTRLNI